MTESLPADELKSILASRWRSIYWPTTTAAKIFGGTVPIPKLSGDNCTPGE